MVEALVLMKIHEKHRQNISFLNQTMYLFAYGVGIGFETKHVPLLFIESKSSYL